MASQNAVRLEIEAWARAHPGENAADAIRLAKLAALKAVTGRPVLIYATDFISPRMALIPQLQSMTNISLRDKDHFPDVVDNITGNTVDFLIQSPGGSAEAVETIVALLRGKFTDIRALVPGTAKSAATMLAMSTNQIVMDSSSELGPTDPQMPANGRYNPAGAIKKQFELAVATLKVDRTAVTAWLPILQMFAPSLLVECEHHIELSKKLVGDWLAQYMFAGEPDAAVKGAEIAAWLSEDSNFYTHARRVSAQELMAHGVKVVDMGADLPLQHAVRELYYAVMTTFEVTDCVKLFENSEGGRVCINAKVQAVQAPPAPATVPPATAPTVPSRRAVAAAQTPKRRSRKRRRRR